MGHRDLLVTHTLSDVKNHKLPTSPTRQRPPRQRLRSNGQLFHNPVRQRLPTHPVIHQSQVGSPTLTSIQNHAPTSNALASNLARRKCYASCRRSRCEQFVAGQRRSATSARTESSAREDACKRRLLHRCTPN